MFDYEIRYARENDAGAISDLLLQAFLEYEAVYTPEAFRATTPSKQEILYRLKDGPVWVAVFNRQVVATVSAIPTERNSLYVRSMGVDPSFRAKGIARTLLRHVETFAVSDQYEFLVLSTTPFLTTAIALYERFGFIRSDDGPQELFGTPLFTMVKRILPL